MRLLIYQIQDNTDSALQQSQDDVSRWIIIGTMIFFPIFGLVLLVQWFNGPGHIYWNLLQAKLGVVTRHSNVTEKIPTPMEEPVEYKVSSNVTESQAITVTKENMKDKHGLVLSKYWVPALLGDTAFAHLLIVASTGRGKTTLIRSMYKTMGNLGKAVMLSPKIQEHKDVLGAGCAFSSEQVEWGMKDLLALLEIRGAEFYHGKADFEPLFIIMDEWSWIRDNCETGSRFMKQISNLGREVKMHLVISNQSGLVEDLGVSGDTRKNFSRIYIGEHAEEQAKKYKMPGFYSSKKIDRPAWFEHGVTAGPVSLEDVPEQVIVPPLSISYRLPSMEKFEQVKAASEERETAKRQEPIQVRQLIPVDYSDLPPTQADYAKAIVLVVENQTNNAMSLGDFARQMGYGDGRGSYTVKAKKLLARVYSETGKTIPSYGQLLEQTREAADA